MKLIDLWNTIMSIPGSKTILIVILLSIVEICPIKLNPWSWVGALIGKLLGITKVTDKLDALEKKVDCLDKKVDENDVIASRVRILRFQSEIEDGKYHSKDSWDQVMTDIAKYEKYVSEHPDFKNGITEPTIEYLKEKYRERLEKKDWNRRPK